MTARRYKLKIDCPVEGDGLWNDIRRSKDYLIHNLLGYKLVIDYPLLDFGPGKPRTMATARYTKQPSHTLISQGYLRAEKWLESLCAAGMPVYVKFISWPEVDAREYGNMETSATLYNWYKSAAMNRWMRGFTRISFDPLDTKALAGVAVVAVGVIAGIFMLLGGGI